MKVGLDVLRRVELQGAFSVLFLNVAVSYVVLVAAVSYEVDHEVVRESVRMEAANDENNSS